MCRNADKSNHSNALERPFAHGATQSCLCIHDQYVNDIKDSLLKRIFTHNVIERRYRPVSTAVVTVAHINKIDLPALVFGHTGSA